MNEEPKRLEDEIVKNAKEYREKLKRWVRQIWQIELEDDFTNTEDFKSAESYYQQFVIDNNVDYVQVSAYAQKLHEAYEDQDQNLDHKADLVIKYLGGGSAIITIGALLSLKTDTWQTCFIGSVILLSLVPSLWQAVLAIKSAISVVHPRFLSFLNPISYAVDIANYHKKSDAISIKLWLQLHAICESYQFRNIQKAKLVADAFKYYLRSIYCLSIPIGTVLLALIILGCIAALKPAPLLSTPTLPVTTAAMSR